MGVAAFRHGVVVRRRRPRGKEMEEVVGDGVGDDEEEEVMVEDMTGADGDERKDLRAEVMVRRQDARDHEVIVRDGGTVDDGEAVEGITDRNG